MMKDAAKVILFGVFGGLAVGGLVGSATFGIWGGVVGSIVGILAGGGTMAIVAGAAMSTTVSDGAQQDESAGVNTE